MNALQVVAEISGLFLGPLVCRVRRAHRPHPWQLHAAPPLVICTRCWRPVTKEAP